LPIFVGGDKPVAHLYLFHPVAPNLHRQWWLFQVVPGTPDCQRRKELLATLMRIVPSVREAGLMENKDRKRTLIS
jgi:hypothetical protein